jgi:hypothetical protein
MFSISIFNDLAKPFHFAITTDETGTALPAGEWKLRHSLSADANRAGPALRGWMRALQQDGYLILKP